MHHLKILYNNVKQENKQNLQIYTIYIKKDAYRKWFASKSCNAAGAFKLCIVNATQSDNYILIQRLEFILLSAEVN